MEGMDKIEIKKVNEIEAAEEGFANLVIIKKDIMKVSESDLRQNLETLKNTLIELESKIDDLEDEKQDLEDTIKMIDNYFN